MCLCQGKTWDSLPECGCVFPMSHLKANFESQLDWYKCFDLDYPTDSIHVTKCLVHLKYVNVLLIIL